MKKYCGPLGVLSFCALMSLPVYAQDEGSAPADEGSSDSGSNASEAGDRRFYLSPMFSYTVTDPDRAAKDAIGGALSVGKDRKSVV